MSEILYKIKKHLDEGSSSKILINHDKWVGEFVHVVEPVFGDTYDLKTDTLHEVVNLFEEEGDGYKSPDVFFMHGPENLDSEQILSDFSGWMFGKLTSGGSYTTLVGLIPKGSEGKTFVFILGTSYRNTLENALKVFDMGLPEVKTRKHSGLDEGIEELADEWEDSWKEVPDMFALMVGEFKNESGQLQSAPSGSVEKAMEAIEKYGTMTSRNRGRALASKVVFKDRESMESFKEAISNIPGIRAFPAKVFKIDASHVDAGKPSLY